MLNASYYIKILCGQVALRSANYTGSGVVAAVGIHSELPPDVFYILYDEYAGVVTCLRVCTKREIMSPAYI